MSEAENTGEHAEGSPEMAHRPEQTGAIPLGTYNVTFNPGCPSEWTPVNPLAPPYHIGDMPWQLYQQQPAVTITTTPALTEERVREIFREELAKWQANRAEIAKLANTVGAEIGRAIQRQASVRSIV